MERMARLARGLGLVRHPLHRRCDTLEARMLAGLLAVLLVCGPLLAVAAFRLAERAGLRQQHNQRAWRQVTASLLRPRSGDVMSLDGAWAPARWTAPDGQVRTGDVPVLGPDWASPTVRMWVDHQGRPTGPPLSGRQLANQAIGAGMLAVAALVLLLSGLGLLAHCLIDRRRLAGWDAAWAAIEPSWTRRGPPQPPAASGRR
jgi:hypothetical protein